MASREEVFESLKSRTEALISELEAQTSSIETRRNEATSKTEEIQNNLTRSAELKSQLDQLVTDLQSQLQSLNESINQTQTRETDTKSLYDQLDQDVKSLKERAGEIISQSENQQKNIAEQLKKANAVGLFHAFDTEKNEHHTSALFWGASTGITLVLILAMGIVLFGNANGHFHWSNILTAQTSDWWGYSSKKLAVLSPFVYWLILSTRQFSKAKRLQEEYAFKSTVSLSLEAYRDMLRREAEDEETREHVIPVLANSVETIFSSPTESIAKHPHTDDKDLLQSAIEVISTQLKIIKEKI